MLDSIWCHICNKTKLPIQSGLLAWSKEPFQYMSWELSAVDMDEEAEDFEALAELERANEGSRENDATEEDDEVSKH